MPRYSGYPVLFALALTGVLQAQSRPVLDQAALDRWETLGQSRLSPDGQWLTWSITRGDQDGTLHLRGGQADRQVAIPFGQSAVFSNDSRWFAYLVGVSTKERERLTKEKKPVRNTFVVRNLANGDTLAVPEVSGFSFAPSGGFVSLTRYSGDDKLKTRDVIVLDLVRGTRTSFANVAEQAWSEVMPLLALTVTVEGGNGIQLFDGATGSTRILESSESLYRSPAWRSRSATLAVLRTIASKEFSDTTHAILTWNAAARGEMEAQVLDPRTAPGFPTDMRIAEYRSPSWSDDGKVLYFGIQPRHAVKDRIKKSDDKVSDVEIWHVNDVRAIPEQRSSEQRDLRATLLSAWHADGRVVQLSTDALESTTILDGDRFVTETDREPYAWGQKFGRRDEDLYVVDVSTGDRRKLLTKIRHLYGADPTGSLETWFDGRDWWTIEVASGARKNLTESVRRTQKADFVDRDDDHPTDVPGPWGGPTWSQDGKTIHVYTEYDVWAIPVDGSAATRLTNGARGEVEYRLASLGGGGFGGFGQASRDRSVDRSKPVWLSLFGKRDKKSGYAQLLPDGTVKQLVFADAQISGLQKADSADRYAFTRQTFEDSPDIFVGDISLADARQLTETNPFQKEYAWGKAELIDFTSTIGRPLQGILYYPANYEAGKKYPMIVYTYEMLSQGLHRYIVPRVNDYYNANVFTQNGYFVLMPDIVFRPRQPGVDAQASVDAAIRYVVGRGLVDPANIGHCGHSQGGYEAYFLATHSSLIKTAVAGAGITDMYSFAGQMHWSSAPEFDHWETGQFRMEVAPWEDWAAMARNNPILKVHEMKAQSILMEIGGEDPTVDMRQGVEFWNYARRAGKQAVMLLYPGEGHGLRKRENAIDYRNRILEWFGHYLKGEPAPTWITNGQTWLERKAILDANKN